MNGRKTNGQFAKGNKFGTGRKISELRKAFLDAVTEDAMKDFALALIERVKTGDVKAAELVLPYLIGKPMEPEDLQKEIKRENGEFTGFRI